MIKLLVICNVDLTQKWGDYVRVFSLMNNLRDEGVDVFVLIVRPEYASPRIKRTQEDGVNVIQIHSPLRFLGNKRISRHIRYLSCYPLISKIASELIEEHGISHVYSYMPGTGSSGPAMKIKARHKIKFILDLADMYSMIKPQLIVNKSFKEADKIIVITKYLMDDLLKRGIPKEKIFQIPNGVDLVVFDPDKHLHTINKIRYDLGAEQLIVYSGALQDLNMVIDSAPLVKAKFPNVKYLIIGDHRDPLKSKSVWEKKIHEKGISDCFIFLGRIQRDKIPPYLTAADVCIDSFPNEPYYAAAHPIKLLEYGGCGKAVVATRISETANIIKHGEFGLLAESGNVEEYASYIIKLLNNPGKTREMGRNFQEYVQREFDWKILAKKLKQILEI